MRLRLRRAVVLFTCVGIVGGAFAVMNSDGLSWRARVIGAKIAGELPEIPVPEFVRWLVPGSSVWLRPLAEYPNVHAAIQNRVVTLARWRMVAKSMQNSARIVTATAEGARLVLT